MNKEIGRRDFLKAAVAGAAGLAAAGALGGAAGDAFGGALGGVLNKLF